jgi:hypothetical protein
MARKLQERVTRDRADGHRHETPDTDTSPRQSSRPRAEVLEAEADALLDEVDAILAENEEFQNAEAFVEAFRQQGGE